MSRDDTQHVPTQREQAPLLEPSQAFLELGRISFDDTSLGEVLQKIADLAKRTIAGAEEVSVTLIDGQRARSVAFTGNLAVHLDERQYADGFGPCMDAALGGQVVSLTDLSTDDRYPDFAALALREGVRSSLSVGMPVPDRTVGGLNIYASSPNAFDEASVELAKAFADYAAVALVNAALIDSKANLARQMEEAMASRAVIEQAKGILIGQLGCTPEEAFAHLSRQSQNGNRKLHQVAVDIVAQAQQRRR